MEPVFKLTPAEEKLAELLWGNAPIPSMELIKLAGRELGWKKSTTFTVLKKLCEKGLVRNDNARVSVLYTRGQFLSGRSRHYVEDAFGGSLPKFITAFIGGGKLSKTQAEELKRLIDEHEE